MNVPQMNITAMLMLPVITQLGHLTAHVMQDIPEMAEVVQVRNFFISLYVTVHITVYYCMFSYYLSCSESEQKVYQCITLCHNMFFLKTLMNVVQVRTNVILMPRALTPMDPLAVLAIQAF